MPGTTKWENAGSGTSRYALRKAGPFTLEVYSWKGEWYGRLWWGEPSADAELETSSAYTGEYARTGAEAWCCTKAEVYAKRTLLNLSIRPLTNG